MPIANKEEFNELQKKLVKQASSCKSDEAIKTALVLPFMQALGWDIFSPDEVVPQFVGDDDDGFTMMDTVDYGVFKDEELAFIMLCNKRMLNIEGCTETFEKYFTEMNAKLGIITNGITYVLYINKDQPLCSFDISDTDDYTMSLINLLYKEDFNGNQIIGYLNDLQQQEAVKAFKSRILQHPSDEMMTVLYVAFTSQVTDMSINKQRFKQLWCVKKNKKRGVKGNESMS